MHASNFQSRHQQQGIATVLIVVLLGLSLTITILVGLSNLRSSQELGVSMHTQTVTQQRAWSAAEALREYLQEVTADYTDWLEFLDNFDLDNNVYPAITMTGFEGLQAQFIGVDDTNPARLLFSLELSAETAPDTRIASTSALQMTFAVKPPTPAGNQPPVTPSRNVITFYDGLDVSGGIEVIPEAGKTYDVFVDGNVKISNVSLTGFDTIRSTKSIQYQGGSGSNFRELHASCDVFVSNVGGFTIDSIRGTNNVCVQDTANTASIEANGFVTVTGGAHNSVASLANTGDEAYCAAGSQPHCGFTNNYGVDVGWSTTARRILTKGEIRSREALNVDAWLAEGIITFDGCPSPASDVTSAVGVVVPSWCDSTFNIDADMNLAIPEVPRVTLDRETFDANLFRDSANYVYRRHNNATRVLVRNVEGMPDHSHVSNPQEVRDNGYFHRSSSVSNRPNYACRHPTANNDAENCWLLSTNSDNSDVHPSFVNPNWTLNGVSHAPGVVFFEGNLRIQNGHYTNTFIATENITLTSSNNSVAAPNYIGANTRSIAVPDFSTHTYQGVCNNIYGLSPRDFCKPGSYDSSALSGLGNFGLKAGSCPSPGQCSTSQYIGGDIAIAGPVLGVIKAGNIFSTSGQTRIEGYVSVLALRGSGTTNRIGNRTVIDLSDLPEGYDPTGGAVDPGDGSGGNGNGGGGTEEAGSATLLWTRYL